MFHWGKMPINFDTMQVPIFPTPFPSSTKKKKTRDDSALAPGTMLNKPLSVIATND